MDLRAALTVAARRIALCALAVCGLSLACEESSRGVPGSPPATRQNAAPPQRSLQALSLPPIQRARLEYLFDAGTALARVWPLLAGELPCVLLVDATTQWLVGCERAPSGDFVQQVERLRGRPVYARSSEHLATGGRTITTQQWLTRSAATAQVEPIGPHASEPIEAGLVWVGTLEAVRAARADFRDCTTDEWLSVALHELMHAWQLRAAGFAHELRAIAAGTLAPEEIRALFVGDAHYRALVEREYRLLVNAATRAPDRIRSRRALRIWNAHYQTRQAYLAARPDGDQLVYADRVFSYLEGVARYVESRFLIDASLHPARAIPGDGDFHGFERYSGGGYATMQNRQLDAEYDYAIGFHVALLLDRLDPSWKDRTASAQSFEREIVGAMIGAAELGPVELP